MVLSPQRRERLKQPDSCYIISWVPDHPADRDRTECQAGFFSLFIRALYGVRLATTYGSSYYVDYGSFTYGYSEPDKFSGDTNFWNYYFVQPPLPSTALSTINTPYETFPLRIWNESFMKDMHQIIEGHIIFQPNVKKLLTEKKNQLQREKRVVGVHVRRTDHPGEVEPVSMTTYVKTIQRVLQEDARIFVATDDARVITLFTKEFGSRVVYNDATRSADSRPVHRLHSDERRYQLGLEALLDCYCLSLCDEAILCHSNLSYAALLFSPALKYTLLETPKHRNLRIKTLLTYHLDRLSTPLPS